VFPWVRKTIHPQAHPAVALRSPGDARRLRPGGCHCVRWRSRVDHRNYTGLYFQSAAVQLRWPLAVGAASTSEDLTIYCYKNVRDRCRQTAYAKLRLPLAA
jgi:hypothetical protein